MNEIALKIILMIMLLVSTISYFYAIKKESKKMEATGVITIAVSLIFAYIVK